MSAGDRPRAKDGYRVRPAAASDADTLLTVHTQSILQLGRATYTAAECESWAAGLVPEGYVTAMTRETYLVAEDREGVCGFCSFRDNEVVGLYIHPRAARRGVGTELLERAEAIIREAAPATVRLTAALSALPFYRARGYRLVQRKKRNTRGGVEIAVCDMEKRLS